jgi:hypothetical protein
MGAFWRGEATGPGFLQSLISAVSRFGRLQSEDGLRHSRSIVDAIAAVLA